jgi:hypothetical protein
MLGALKPDKISVTWLDMSGNGSWRIEADSADDNFLLRPDCPIKLAIYFSRDRVPLES